MTRKSGEDGQINWDSVWSARLVQRRYFTIARGNGAYRSRWSPKERYNLCEV